MSYTCFPWLEVQDIAHLCMFGRRGLYTTDDKAHDIAYSS